LGDEQAFNSLVKYAKIQAFMTKAPVYYYQQLSIIINKALKFFSGCIYSDFTGSQALSDKRSFLI